eukprot:CAMPEP_0172707884 /NCGR_PEP_ID=MMETSP1074-20121228/50237_1 /TAXON_ID=2916 /ORGANISM="Ceratium fusus, Strain PA161109" /LENGTH=241 /DNA_ID=CAMNT_0013530759 /DNA_START=78 /DNA_END=803 /DNA_ORIENTATION=+
MAATMLKQHSFVMQSGVIFMSTLLLHQHTTLAERRTDEVADVYVNNRHELQEDAVLEALGSMAARNGSDRDQSSNKIREEPLESKSKNALDWAIKIKGLHESIQGQQRDAQDIIVRGEADIKNLQSQISEIDVRLATETEHKERCLSRISKAEEELNHIQVKYDELVSQADQAILCLKGSCEKVDSEEEIGNTTVDIEQLSKVDIVDNRLAYGEVDEKHGTTKGPTTTSFLRQSATIQNKS